MPLVAEVWCMYSFYQSERFFYLEFCLMYCIICNLWSKKKPSVCCEVWFSQEFLNGELLALAGLKLLRGPGCISGYPFFWGYQNTSLSHLLFGPTRWSLHLSLADYRIFLDLGEKEHSYVLVPTHKIKSKALGGVTKFNVLHGCFVARWLAVLYCNTLYTHK